MVNRFLSELKKINVELRDEEVAKRWLTLSKGVKKNPLGEWGKSGASGVKARGIKDFAYLMMRKHGSPMHFREVAKAITNTFSKKCHTATCHNELIKDKRFVLVGRGMYALSEWGYKPGVVRDVIKEILKREGSMTKEDVVDKVLKERYLKKNTILVNLQNPKYFKKNKNKRTWVCRSFNNYYRISFRMSPYWIFLIWKRTLKQSKFKISNALVVWTYI